MTDTSAKPAPLSLSGLQALLESARLLNSSLSLKELLSHLLRTVMGRLLVTRGAIAIENGGEMRLELARGVPGVNKGDRFRETEAREARLELVYPIGPADRPVGLLALSNPALGAVTPDQQELLLSLLELAATAMANARAHEHAVTLNRSLDQNVQELRAILDLARGLAAKTDADEIAHLLALTLAGRWTVRKHAVAAWREGHAPVLRQRGIALPELPVLRQLAATLVEPAYTVETLPDAAAALAALVPGGVLFPIRTSEELMGIVMCGARPPGLSYSASDLEFGAGLIAQASVAFENAWRMEEILARRQMEQELAIAASIQENLFPARLPDLPFTDLAARNRQARQVGGDYYDVLPMCSGSGAHLLCVADISGKGLPASLLMSSIQATLRAVVETPCSLADLTTRVNALLHANTPSNRFATAFLAAYDSASGACTYVNGGHNDGILLRRDGSVELLTTTGLPVGMFARATYEEARVHLASGDLLMLYSDGVTEAENTSEEEFGMDRVIEVLKAQQARTAAEVVDSMVTTIDGFVGSAPQHDDLTLMVLKRKD